MELYQYIIAIIGGAVAGSINTLAGSGSAITLTIFTEILGLPPNVANGSNRVGTFTQTAAATYGFYKNGKLNLKRSKGVIILTTIGAIGGVIVATQVSNEQFKTVFSYLMIAMLFVILIKPKRWLRETDAEYRMPQWIFVPLFLAIGFYGGFIQMGMGVIFLVAMVLGAKYSIIESNAVKAFVVALYTIVVIAIFQWKGLIDWKMGGIVAIGQTVGGYMTAQFASRYEQANVWAHRVLVVMVIAAIIMIFDLHEYLF
ncbi:MAG: sulfite exporter TauE/SafE family protein [Saprospiraceae bacterium]